MKKFIDIVYNIITKGFVFIIMGIIFLYVVIYVALSLSSVQNRVRSIAEEELTKLLTAQVKIGKVSFAPIDNVVLEDAYVLDQKNDTILSIDKLGAGVDFYKLIFNQRFVFTFAKIIGLNASINKETPDAPLNIQFIIDALKPKDKNKPPTKFDLEIHNVILRRCNIAYDVLSEPARDDRFDKNHIKVQNLRADIDIPKLKNNDFAFDIRRLSFSEKSGFYLTNLATLVTINDNQISAENFVLSLPNSLIKHEKLALNINSLATLGKDLKELPIEAQLDSIKITPADLRCFVPALKAFETPAYISTKVSGSINHPVVSYLNISTSNDRIKLSLEGDVSLVPHQIEFDVPRFELRASATEIARVTSNLTNLSPKVKNIIVKCGDVHLKGSVAGSRNVLDYNGNLSTALGAITLNGSFNNDSIHKAADFKGYVKSPQFAIGSLLNKTNLLNCVALDANVAVRIGKGKLLRGTLDGKIPFVDFKNYRYSNIAANVQIDRNQYSGTVELNDPNATVQLLGEVLIDGENSTCFVEANLEDVDLNALNLIKQYPDHHLSLDLSAEFCGNKPDNSTGDIFISNINFLDHENKGLHLDKLNIAASNNTHPKTITIESDILNGGIEGEYQFASVVRDAKDIVAQIYPALIPDNISENVSGNNNNFEFAFTIEPDEAFQDFFHLPVRALDKIKLNGAFSETNNKIIVDVDAPYLLQGKKIIENTGLHAEIHPSHKSLNLNVHTLMPMKNRKVQIELNGLGAANTLNTDLSWKVKEDKRYYGNINLTSTISRNILNNIDGIVTVNPTKVAFNDTTWTVHPSTIEIVNKNVKINSFRASHENQFININGLISDDIDDKAQVDLSDISLDYIFETLNINNVDFGGNASGTAYASGLKTKTPRLYIPKLHVVDLAYNKAVMGDADISAEWENATKGILLDATIHQKNGETTLIDGGIYPAADSLRMNFHPRRANVAFLKPFVATFTTAVSGEVSGDAKLYGKFSTLDLVGDVYADVKMRLDYTNVYYSAKDSVIMRSGLIKFNHITLRDRDGHTGVVDGVVTHDCFRDAKFKFTLHDADHLLCYDTTQKNNDVWYGTIYGSGSASLDGGPGVVSINVRMESEENSKFTFVLTNTQAASEYNFITFVDRNKSDEPEPVDESIPEIVRRLQATKKKEEDKQKSMFYITLEAAITDQAEMRLVMDPLTGDNIVAHGNGNMHLAYSNADDQLNMRGKYTLTNGKYHFTLQDIIIKDFTIAENSSVSFDGSPYNATLDIKAMHTVNANITDLDDSFATDRELNRTNVPVHAVLIATGPMNQPELSFDLEFPTLTSEAVSKVKSVISTDDMMNRQIIYLLALSKFYTPEYMNATDNGSELASVASSTISSQLSNLLGQISENWQIAPKFRTDKGDFSDMEVDVALSSRLLNNRLLLNGNFGYRDNSMNTRSSNFIGDFDIEYLLNRQGTIRLKAYNHFNDQNYYIRNALTTQGVGVEFKYDFNKVHEMFDWMRRKPKQPVEPTDSVKK